MTRSHLIKILQILSCERSHHLECFPGVFHELILIPQRYTWRNSFDWLFWSIKTNLHCCILSFLCLNKPDRKPLTVLCQASQDKHCALKRVWSPSIFLPFAHPSVHPSFGRHRSFKLWVPVRSNHPNAASLNVKADHWQLCHSMIQKR